MEPELRSRNIIRPWLLDAVIVPIVGFDRQCNRMGTGKGYYDTIFSFKKDFVKPQLIGIAFDEQKFFIFNRNFWDVPMDIIITPSRVFRRNG